ncbi:MAG: O-antigen ligase family protein [Acidobacteriota bacterium]
MEKSTKHPAYQSGLNQFSWKLEKPFNFFSVSLILLIFFSILPYASSDVWSEAIICIIVFSLNIIITLQKKYSALDIEYTKLLAPLMILAVYSFAQGTVTLLIQNQTLPFSDLLPYSFDLTASFWNAIKIFAFISLIRLLLITFRKNIKLLVWSLITIGSFNALLGIVRYFLQRSFPDTFQYFIFPQLEPNIGFGTFINQNHFAFLMLMTIGLTVSLLWRGKLENYLRYFLLLLSLIVWVSLILTASRGGISSSFGEIAVLIFFPFNKFIQNTFPHLTKKNISKKFSVWKKLTIFAGISLALILGVVFIGQRRVTNRFEKLPQQVEDSEEIRGFKRIDVYAAATKIIGKNPIYGVGFGGFRFAVPRYIDISGLTSPEQAHNDYLEFISASGIIGLILAVWFLVGFFKLLKKRFYESSNWFSVAARLGAVCGITGVAMHSLFDYGLQWMANLIFFAALFVIVIHKESSSAKDVDNKLPPPRSESFFGINYFRIALFSGLIIVCAIFGFSRFVSGNPKIIAGFGVNADNLIKFPFDAEFYEEKAVADISADNTAEAEKNLRKAITYRPNDYILWLKSAQLHQSENKIDEASEDFRRSIELAPYYAEPHYYYGKFLIDNNEQKGFEELRYAFRQNPFYFYDVAALAWQKTGENGVETIKILSPLDLPEAAMMNMFFLDKQSYTSVVAFNCVNEDRSLDDTVAKRLLEKKEYYFANLIFKHICNDSAEKVVGFEDGDFEDAELQKGRGLGWRFNSSSTKEIEISFDKTTASSGNSSLELNFKGNVKPNTSLISQVLFVEKNKKYILTFSYKTSELVTGGVPVLQTIIKQNDSDIKINEIELLPENKDWIQSSVEIDTNENTEAIEVRLSRRSCKQRLCPIYGRLWLDNFRIQEKK